MARDIASDLTEVRAAVRFSPLGSGEGSSSEVMCVRVYNTQTDQETEDIGELEIMLGVPIVPMGNYGPIDRECCLCQVDVEKTARAAGFVYVEHRGDYMDVHVWPHGDYQI